MTAVAWVFLTAFMIAMGLLVIALKGDEELAAENRRLRAQLARRHPALRVVGRSDGGA